MRDSYYGHNPVLRELEKERDVIIQQQLELQRIYAIRYNNEYGRNRPEAKESVQEMQVLKEKRTRIEARIKKENEEDTKAFTKQYPQLAVLQQKIKELSIQHQDVLQRTDVLKKAFNEQTKVVSDLRNPVEPSGVSHGGHINTLTRDDDYENEKGKLKDIYQEMKEIYQQGLNMNAMRKDLEKEITQEYNRLALPYIQQAEKHTLALEQVIKNIMAFSSQAGTGDNMKGMDYYLDGIKNRLKL